MGIGTGSAALIGGLSAAGSIGAGAIGASAASNAASTQANAADYAANLQAQQAQEALQFQEEVYGNQQQNIAPWLNMGKGALSTLGELLGITPATTGTGTATPATGPGFNATGNPPFPGTTTSGAPGPIPLGNVLNGSPLNAGTFTANPAIGSVPRTGPQPIGTAPVNRGGTPSTTGAPAPGSTSSSLPPGTSFGSLLQGYNTPFTPPTLQQAEEFPGYQFELQQGEQALQNSAAARGGLLSTGTAKNLEDYAQGLAQTDYTSVYNEALQNYSTNFNVFQANQANQFNRLAALAGVGQTAAQQLNSAGSSAAGNVSGTLLTSGQQIGQQVNNAAAAQASGYVGEANALGGALGGTTSNIGQLLLLNQLYGGGGASAPAAGNTDVWSLLA